MKLPLEPYKDLQRWAPRSVQWTECQPFIENSRAVIDPLRETLRQQAEQIDAMKLTINNMSGILDDQSEALLRKDALLRLIADNSTPDDWPNDIMEALEKELSK